MESTDKKFIDVKEVIRSKNATLAKLLPGFLLGYIKRIVHQDHINDFIRRHGGKTSFGFVDAVVEEFKVNVAVKGEQNIITTGGCIYASNHPIGGLDGLALLQVLGKHRRDVKFIVNDILLQITNLKDLFTGVNKHGKNAAEVLETIDTLYASDMAIIVFPAGLVSRKQGNVIKDLQWKKSFVNKAKKYSRPVVPVHIEGSNSNFFYNLSNWRKKLGIKANFEMFYLMDEMYHQENKTLTITFGKPIMPETLNNNFSDGEWADKLKEHIYALAKNENAEFKIPVV